MPKGQFGFDFRDIVQVLENAESKEYDLYGVEDTLKKVEGKLPEYVHLSPIPTCFLRENEFSRVFLVERRVKF